jgi:dipeptidyl aminopeptidase/acylaminoacyl peptidase
MSNPLGKLTHSPAPTEEPYDKYSFERLAVRTPVVSQIEIGRKIAETDRYTSYLFYYRSEGRRISGWMNIPTRTDLVGKLPVVVMARGYADKAGYTTGTGTKPAARVYAESGYITLAPDFSGYGESDSEDPDPFGARLSKPVEIIDLIASVGSLTRADTSHIYLWGHSNGGQIMLSVAEILGDMSHPGWSLQGQTMKVRGLVLWAPVSKPFPYSILYYTDQPPDSPPPGASPIPDDEGKALRKSLATFEDSYNVLLYSIDKYWDWIQIPIQLHQGTADPLVPKVWSDALVKTLKDKGKDVTYWIYPGADHQLNPGWATVVARDAQWFESLK